MSKTMLLAASAALVLVAIGGAHAGRLPVIGVGQQPKHTILFPQRGARLLYDQSDADNGNAIRAENFESDLDSYDTEAADDFKVPAGETWKISEVYVAAIYFEGSRSADSFNVTFYESRKGKVGKRVKACMNAGYRYDTQFDFGTEYITCKVQLTQGAYFVAVQANTVFSEGGDWGWLTNNTVRRNPSVWRNPGDCYATGCTDFAPTKTCIPYDEGGDFAFALLGRRTG
jgi:hypothetical protein